MIRGRRRETPLDRRAVSGLDDQYGAPGGGHEQRRQLWYALGRERDEHHDGDGCRDRTAPG